MNIFELIENYFPYIFPPFFGLIITIVTISFLRKSKDWKRMEINYPDLSNNKFKKLGTLHELRFDFLPYRNIFGLGLSEKGLILYPTTINKLTHK